MLKENQEYIIQVEDMSSGGEGVGKIDGFTVFLPQAVEGDRVKAKLRTIKKNYAVGEIIEILDYSDKRMEPICPLFGDCGGCQIMHMSYPSQLDLKRRRVEESLKRIGKIDIPVEDCLGMEEPLLYRNKGQFPIGIEKGKAVIGAYRKGSHEIVDTDYCYIQAHILDQVLKVIKDYIDKYQVPVYDEKKKTGLLRYFISRYSFSRNQLMVILVTNGWELPYKEELILALKEIPEFVSLVQNKNKAFGNYALGKESRVLYGPGIIVEELGDLSFEISAKSFFQVNTSQTQVLYDKVLEFADLKGHENVFDIYCGLGSISLFLAEKAGHVHGIEIVADAIEDAKRNAERNGIKNTSFYAGRAEDLLPQLYDEGLRAHVLVVDPPRKGCDQSVLETILQMEPEKIIYVSCNPASLARDLAFLLKDGSYSLEEVQPVDLFPQTSHIECVVRIQKTS